MEDIRLHLGKKPDLLLMRNQSGAVERENKNGSTRWETYGMMKGAADLIGVLAVGGFICSPFGRFFALEVKRPGKKATEKQQLFIDLINRFGGYAAWTDSKEDAERHYLKAGGAYPDEGLKQVLSANLGGNRKV